MPACSLELPPTDYPEEAVVWVTTVLMTGWLDKFPKLKAAVLESNVSWLPLVLGNSKHLLDRSPFSANRPIRDPYESFHERCFIGFESDQVMAYGPWDLLEDVVIWYSDHPNHDAEDAWEALDLMTKYEVPVEAREDVLAKICPPAPL